MATIQMQEGANLFMGDEAEGKHLALENVKVPDLVEATQGHTPGAGGVAVDFATHMEALEASFDLKGWDEAVYTHFGLGADNRKTYTILGALRDKRTGTVKECKSVIEGRLGRIAVDNYTVGDLSKGEYGIIEITRYTLTIGGAERFHWDFWSGRKPRTDGRSRDDDIARILQLQ